MNTFNKICVLTLATMVGFSSAVSIFEHDSGRRAATEDMIGSGSMNEMQMMRLNHMFSQMNAPEVNTAAVEQYPVMREGPVSVMPSSHDAISHGFFSSPLLNSPPLKRNNIEPYVNLYIPTYRCTHGFYCRAVMTAYYNKQAKTVTVSYGYTVFSTTTATATLPVAILSNIKKTTGLEISTYAARLLAEMKIIVPQLCIIPPKSAFNAMRAATVAMDTCTEISGYTCSKYSYVTTCKV